ncbi:hypothetical protein NDU88_012600 [Pleurodeles waltl]|uniref:Uncharacterized protein n=1 Tax=Pleurodeles waltl TaxID=8319 RepID=A0AAV7R6A0_PLEWA|nr:hypothetical protein NDU88_012600 [Pleurodeles waltl]
MAAGVIARATKAPFLLTLQFRRHGFWLEEYGSKDDRMCNKDPDPFPTAGQEHMASGCKNMVAGQYGMCNKGPDPAPSAGQEHMVSGWRNMEAGMIVCATKAPILLPLQRAMVNTIGIDIRAHPGNCFASQTNLGHDWTEVPVAPSIFSVSAQPPVGVYQTAQPDD